MRRFAPLLVALACALLASSCLLVNDPNAHAATPVDAEAFCGRFAQAVCDGYFHCCTDPSRNHIFANESDCRVQAQMICTSGSNGINLNAIIHDPRTGYDPLVAGEVLNQLAYDASVCDPQVARWVQRRDGFERALTGTVENGAACLRDNPLTNVAAFLSCEDPTRACVLTGLTTGDCLLRRQAGESCVLDFDCREGLYCAPSVGANSCAPRLPEGSACAHNGSDHGAWCESGVCAGGLCVRADANSVYCSFLSF
jgi:hypothetical protein